MTTDPTLDLDALNPADDNKPPFTFRFGGEVFELAAPSAFDARHLRDLYAEAASNPSAVFEEALGPDGWERLESLEDVFTIRHLNAVTEAWESHYETNAPKSSGSPKPSKKRTIR